MFRVLMFTLTHFLAKTIFPECMYGGVKNSSGGVGWGGYFSGQNMEILGSRSGGLSEIPSVVGVWLFFGTT